MPALAPELSPDEEEVEDVAAASELVEDAELSAPTGAEECVVDVMDEVLEPVADELVAELVIEEEVVVVEESVILIYWLSKTSVVPESKTPKKNVLPLLKLKYALLPVPLISMVHVYSSIPSRPRALGRRWKSGVPFCQTTRAILVKFVTHCSFIAVPTGYMPSTFFILKSCAVGKINSF